MLELESPVESTVSRGEKLTPMRRAGSGIVNPLDPRRSAHGPPGDNPIETGRLPRTAAIASVDSAAAGPARPATMTAMATTNPGRPMCLNMKVAECNRPANYGLYFTEFWLVSAEATSARTTFTSASNPIPIPNANPSKVWPCAVTHP